MSRQGIIFPVLSLTGLFPPKPRHNIPDEPTKVDHEIFGVRAWANLSTQWRGVKPFQYHTEATTHTMPPIETYRLHPIAYRDIPDTWYRPVAHANEKPELWGYTGLYACRPNEFTEVSEIITNGGYGVARSYTVGIVALRGTVIEHEKGYRAERAVIRGLMTFNEDLVPVLAKHYQCDVLFLNIADLPETRETPVSPTLLEIQRRMEELNAPYGLNGLNVLSITETKEFQEYWAQREMDLMEAIAERYAYWKEHIEPHVRVMLRNAGYEGAF